MISSQSFFNWLQLIRLIWSAVKAHSHLPQWSQDSAVDDCVMRIKRKFPISALMQATVESADH